MSVAKAPGVPKGDETITITALDKIAEGRYRVSYDFAGVIQVKKGPRTKYSVILPRSTEEDFLYNASINKRGINTCTDEHYNTIGDFWYFWDPSLPQCRLQEGVHYDVVTGDLERIPNTTLTYPEYSRLVNSQGIVPIYVFFGKDSEEHDDNPMTSKDLNAKTYRAFRKSLMANGFSDPTRMPNEMIQKILHGEDIASPFVEVTELVGDRATLRVVMFFGNTGMDEESDAFHYFYKVANESGSIMIYDGHSGLGGHLDPKAIEERHGFKMRTIKNKYQIFFFNSCTSYTYYNSLYFYRKDRKSVRNQTRNLDIMTQGLAAEFDVKSQANVMLVKAVAQWANNKKAPSYQKLAEQMDQNSLFGINGDEDNPTEPGLE
jgi:hypothetical protein